MSIFAIDKLKKNNYIDGISFKNSIKNQETKPLINDFNNTTTANITKIYEKKPINLDLHVPDNNDRRNVRMSLDTTAIRQNRLNYFTQQFDPGYPNVSNYPLCPQKISTIFQNGGYHWTQNTMNGTSSYPFKGGFFKVVDAINLTTNDCTCYYIDYSGEYVLNWSKESGGQLLSSSNKDIQLGTFNFYIDDEYFNIFLYPKPSLNNTSYVHIRYRIPLRYRYIYKDWTFWESLIIDNTMSDTEFVKVIDCCSTKIDDIRTISANQLV